MRDGRGPRRRSWRLDGDRWPVRSARRITAETLAAWRADGWRDDALTVVSELATNAIAYGGAPITLSLALLPAEGEDKARLQIDVTDASDQLPREREPGEDGGYGLLILEGYAQITVHVHPGGKTIRAVL